MQSFKPEYMSRSEYEERLVKKRGKTRRGKAPPIVHLLYQISEGTPEGQEQILRAIYCTPERAQKTKEMLEQRDTRRKTTGVSYRIDEVLCDHVFALGEP
ncbi:MAG: hypothetical protein WCA89_08075 [Terracidiphilus sp.]